MKFNSELWLEFGKQMDDGFQNMFWYNEGRTSELFYFIKHLFKYLFKKNMYYMLRFGWYSIYFKGYEKQSKF